MSQLRQQPRRQGHHHPGGLANVPVVFPSASALPAEEGGQEQDEEEQDCQAQGYPHGHPHLADALITVAASVPVGIRLLAAGREGQSPRAAGQVLERGGALFSNWEVLVLSSLPFKLNENGALGRGATPGHETKRRTPPCSWGTVPERSWVELCKECPPWLLWPQMLRAATPDPSKSHGQLCLPLPQLAHHPRPFHSQAQAGSESRVWSPLCWPWGPSSAVPLG